MTYTARELAEKLEVSLPIIYGYASYIGISVLNLAKGQITEEQMLKIKECHSSEKIRNEISAKIKRDEEDENSKLPTIRKDDRSSSKPRNIKRRLRVISETNPIDKLKKTYGFEKKHYVKFITQVKWFYNKQEKLEEGYVTLQNKIDFYFLGRNVKGIDPFQLKKNDYVVISVNNRSFYNHRIPVTSLTPLEYEDDKLFLVFSSLLPNASELCFSKAYEVLKDEQLSAKELSLPRIRDIFDEIIISSEPLSDRKAIIVYLINAITKWQENNKLSNIFFNRLDENGKFQFWKKLNIDYPFNIIQDIILQAIEFDVYNFKGISSKLSEEDLTWVLNNLAEENLFKLWKEGLTTVIPSEYINIQLDNYYKYYLVESQQAYPKDLSTVKNRIVDLVKKNISDQELENIIKYLLANNSSYHSIDLYEKINFTLKLWISTKDARLNILRELCPYPIEAIYEEFVNKNIPSFKMVPGTTTKKTEKGTPVDYFKENKNKPNHTSKISGELFYEITYEDLEKIYQRSIYEIGIVDSDIKYQEVLFFLNLLTSVQVNTEHDCASLKKYYLNAAYKNFRGLYKLRYFVDDFVDTVDYDEVVNYTIFLSPEKQKVFFKKILKKIETNQLSLGIQDLKRMVTIDYELSEQAKKIDGNGLDFTISVILKIVEDLSNGIVTKRNNLFDLLANQIKRPQDLLEITGFFEKCEGRTIVKPKTKYNQEKEPITVYEKEKTTYRAHAYLDATSEGYCDGRKAINRITEKASICTTSGLEFWWCENTKCYAACRTTHNHESWRNYTLIDVLRILKVPFDEKQYEIVLNVINRVNRFLKHLSCRECNKILRPVGKANYAFYGVTRFHCIHDNCTEKENEIYLSHCSNSKCPDIIDSRDSVRCKPKNTREKCGWYICNNCYACCTTSNISRRKSIMSYTGQEYKCHEAGHKDLGIICCKECGSEMQEHQFNREKYQENLDWFINYKDSIAVANYGQRKDGKWWFIWQKGKLDEKTYRQKLEALKFIGFNIPSIDETLNFKQLVAEPFKESFANEALFKCEDCSHTLEVKFREEFPLSRKIAVESFHNVAIKKLI